MNRKPSSVGTLGPPGENRRMSMAKGLGLPSDSARRQSSVAVKPAGSSGPSLVGLLASKRLAKRLTTRFFDRRGGRMYGSRPSAQIHVQKEPSYRMEPHKKFCPNKVREVIAEVLEGKLEKFKYNPKFCSNISKVLADEIKDKVKLLNYDRYKLVCQVNIGEKKDQNIISCSRSVWDDHLDSYATYTFMNRYIFCTASVFGVYSE